MLPHINNSWPKGGYLYNRYGPSLVLALLGLVYIIGRADYIPFGDGLGYAMAATGQQPDLSTNATSHLAYQLLLWTIVNVFNLKVALALSLLSLGFAILTLWQLDVLLDSLQHGVTTRLVVILSLGLSFIFWRHAEIPEMYTCYWFCLVIAFRLTNYFFKTQTYTAALVLGVWSGFTLTVHIAHLLYMLPLGLTILYVGRWQLIGQLFTVTLTTIICCSPLLILPLSQGDELMSAINGVLFDRLEDAAGLQEGIFKSYGKGLIVTVLALAYNFGLSALLYIWLLYKRYSNISRLKKPFDIFLTGFVVLSVVYFGRFANLQVAPFYTPVYIAVLVLLADSLDDQLRKRMKWFVIALFAQPLVYVLAHQVALAVHHPAVIRFAIAKDYKGGLAYYLLPWQQPGLDALKTIEKVNQMPPSQEKIRLIEDIGYNYPQGLELIERRKHDKRLMP